MYRRGRGRRAIGQVYITAIYELIKDLEEDVGTESELYKILEQLLKRNASLTISNSLERTCNIFTTLVERNFTNLVRLFLSCGLDIKHIDKEWSLLQYPAASGNLELAKLLVKNGASIESDNETNPIVIAVASGHHKLVEFLVSKFPSCVSLLGKNKPESTKNYLELVEEEVDQDDEVDMVRNGKISALHAAVLDDHPNLIPTLIKSGIPVDIVSGSLTPLQLAIILDKPLNVEAILRHNPDLFILRNSSTLLDLMIGHSDISMLKRFKHL